MRRLDPDNHAPRTDPPPFRVLGVVGPNQLAPPSPPPPRAPEPYKVASPGNYSTRAHRRSSFVILAENQPTSTPTSRSTSPTLATGRASPFRGRGFKGPPPHAQSRPQTPENASRRKRGRFDKRVSVSQQNSPKRSLIPRPTRQRSISLSKSEERLASPKPVRRFTSRGSINIGAKTSVGRSASLKVPGLSPIQGTPTKPADKGGGEQEPRSKRSSPAKFGRNSVLPPKGASSSRQSIKEKSPNKRTPSSPSRIPLKRGLVKGKGVPSQSPSKTQSSKPSRTSDLPVKRFIEIPDSNSKKAGVGGSGSTKSEAGGSGPSNENARFIGDIAKVGEVDDGLGLIDLLKQTSGATGTSSVVNTTTATAVKPLHIDAIPVSSDLELGTKSASPKSAEGGINPGAQGTTKQQEPPSASQPPDSKNGTQSAQQPSTASMQMAKGGNDSSARSNIGGNGDGKKEVLINGANQSGRAGHSKTSSSGQSLGGAGKSNPAEGTSTPGAHANGRKNQNNVLGDPVTAKQEMSTADSTNTGKRSPGSEILSAKMASKVQDVEMRGQSGERAVEKSNGRLEKTGAMQANVEEQAMTSGVESEGKNGDGRQKANGRDDRRTSNRLVSSAKRVIGAVNMGRTNGVKKGKDGPNGRSGNVSANSSTEMSSGSLGSVRSTDTGVSLNTVRGVSSAREKEGMHLVEKPREIETLSGNLAHLESNGEPTVPASPDEDEEELVQSRFARLKRFLSNRCKCCSRCDGMRCLACRRGPKGQTWPTRNVEDAPPNLERQSCWARLKSACRCPKCPRSKCCGKGARVAPAESTTCCPPERRCAALCRNLFSRCKCKRKEPQRMRSIRAKHSLTSVAAPPLSEEPKEKIPEVLVEHNSVMRGAIPCLPVPLAWFCLVWNVLIPGSGTLWSGLFNLCAGQPRFSTVAGPKARLGAFIVNLIVSVSQLFTVLFCLVGWGWSIWWGITMIRLARKYKRFRASEAAAGDPEARMNDATGLPPGVPSHALRGLERSR